MIRMLDEEAEVERYALLTVIVRAYHLIHGNAELTDDNRREWESSAKAVLDQAPDFRKWWNRDHPERRATAR